MTSGPGHTMVYIHGGIIHLSKLSYNISKQPHCDCDHGILVGVTLPKSPTIWGPINEYNWPIRKVTLHRYVKFSRDSVSDTDDTVIPTSQAGKLWHVLMRFLRVKISLDILYQENQNDHSPAAYRQLIVVPTIVFWVYNKASYTPYGKHPCITGK